MANLSKNSDNTTTICGITVSDQTEQAIIGILSDHIMWFRVSNGMFKVINAFHPSECENDFTPDFNFHGYSNAFKVLGIWDEDELVNKLTQIYLDNYLDSEENAETLAHKMYFEWMVIIRNYFTKKTAA
ncbi:MAG: hypothetical protein ACK5JD_10780 [Mangrovibacterium sp.]